MHLKALINIRLWTCWTEYAWRKKESPPKCLQDQKPGYRTPNAHIQLKTPNSPTTNFCTCSALQAECSYFKYSQKVGVLNRQGRKRNKKTNQKENISKSTGGANKGKSKNAFCYSTQWNTHFYILSVHALLLCKDLAAILSYRPAPLLSGVSVTVGQKQLSWSRHKAEGGKPGVELEQDIAGWVPSPEAERSQHTKGKDEPGRWRQLLG